MKNTIIASIVAVICTAAICITGASVAKSVTADKVAATPTYMTEEQAMEYIGLDKTVFALVKDDLKLFKGAYEEYTYTNEAGEEVTVTIYKKDKLDEAVDKYMAENSALNFKFIQEAKANSAK